MTHEELIKHYDVSKLNSEEKTSLNHYSAETQNAFDLNQHLWDHQIHPWEETENHIKNISSALNKFKTPHDMTVHSGIDPYFAPHSRQTYTHHAFLSTSIDPEVAHSFAKYHGEASSSDEDPTEYHILHIHVPKGHSGLYLHNSPNNHEKEFLLPHGTKLKHERTETKDHPEKDDTIVHHHYMKIIK